MTEYENLNLPQLLQLMHDFVVPESVSWMPQAPGWSIVWAWLVVVILLCLVAGTSRWRATRHRREALAALKTIAKHQLLDDGPARIAALLKRTALAAYPRSRVASLYGAEWAQFLIETSNHDRVVAAAASDLARAAYQPVAEPAALVKAARRWIRRHRV